jgi:hypothetical protein
LSELRTFSSKISFTCTILLNSFTKASKDKVRKWSRTDTLRNSQLRNSCNFLNLRYSFICREFKIEEKRALCKIFIEAIE